MTTIHGTLTGSYALSTGELHDPLGSSRVGALTLIANTVGAYKILNSTTGLLVQIDTTTGAPAFAFGNASENPPYVFYGTGRFVVNSGQITNSIATTFQFGDVTYPIGTFRIGNGTSAASPSGATVTGTPASGTSGAAGGPLTYTSGQGGLGSTGASPTAGGLGGGTVVIGGQGGAGTSAGTIAQGSNAGAGGATTVQGGSGGLAAVGVGRSNGGAGGATTVQGGAGAGAVGTSTGGQQAANAGAGGTVSITGGGGGSGTTSGSVANGTAGAGGAVTILGGNAGTAGSTGTANGGAVSIDGGVQTGGGTNGSVTIGVTFAPSVLIGRSAGIIGFFGSAGTTQQASGGNLTNNVTSGGSTDVIADFTSLTTYSTDAAAIRNNIYQLARKVKQVNDALRAYGLLT